MAATGKAADGGDREKQQMVATLNLVRKSSSNGAGVVRFPTGERRREEYAGEEKKEVDA